MQLHKGLKLYLLSVTCHQISIFKNRSISSQVQSVKKTREVIKKSYNKLRLPRADYVQECTIVRSCLSGLL